VSKIKHIFVTGDSFSFGQELGGAVEPPNDFYTFTPYMREKSYTGIITDAWGVNGYTNNSRPSSSNDRIIRTIITTIPILLETYKPEGLFVFISMSHASRREFYNSEDGTWFDMLSNYSPYINSIEYHLWKPYTAYFNHVVETTKRYITQVLSIQSFLKSLGIDYLMTDSMVIDNTFTDEYNKIPLSIRSTVDRKHYPDIFPFNRYVSSLKLPFGKENHPLEEGHAAWAKYLMEYMKQNGIGEL